MLRLFSRRKAVESFEPRCLTVDDVSGFFRERSAQRPPSIRRFDTPATQPQPKPARPARQARPHPDLVWLDRKLARLRHLSPAQQRAYLHSKYPLRMRRIAKKHGRRR